MIMRHKRGAKRTGEKGSSQEGDRNRRERWRDDRRSARSRAGKVTEEKRRKKKEAVVSGTGNRSRSSRGGPGAELMRWK